MQDGGYTYYGIETDSSKPLRCLNCGSTAQVKLECVDNHSNVTTNIYKCGCGASIEIDQTVKEIRYYSSGVNPTLLKTERN